MRNHPANLHAALSKFAVTAAILISFFEPVANIMGLIVKRLLVLGSAAIVLVAGGIYAVVRPPSYESSASIALVPKPNAPSDLQTLLQSDTVADTAGTYVELLSSPSTRERRFHGVHVTADDVPDTSIVNSGNLTRVIELRTRSRKEQLVRPALGALISTGRAREAGLDDLWDIHTLSSPTAPKRIGPTRGRIVTTSVLLSLFAALVVSALIRQLGSARPPRRRRRRSAASRRARGFGSA
jgi:uncharacterized protein involved in exopolysaccharide biosynthesis